VTSAEYHRFASVFEASTLPRSESQAFQLYQHPARVINVVKICKQLPHTIKEHAPSPCHPHISVHQRLSVVNFSPHSPCLVVNLRALTFTARQFLRASKNTF
jgi:hypothetical protein